MKVFDCFTYFNEDELLEIRLQTLDAHVDCFVIAEATHTQSGLPKPMNFRPERFARFAHKIRYILVDDMPLARNDAWANENHQRNALMRGLADAAPDDLILVSDLDEIPDPRGIAAYQTKYLRGTFIQRLFYYRLNNEALDPASGAPLTWRGPQITTCRHLRGFFGNTQNLRIYKPTGPLRTLRRKWLKSFSNQDIAEGGWHFSWVMPCDRMLAKIHSMAHQEFNTAQIASLETIDQLLREGKDILQRNLRFRRIELDDSFPPCLLQSRERLREFIL